MLHPNSTEDEIRKDNEMFELVGLALLMKGGKSKEDLITSTGETAQEFAARVVREHNEDTKSEGPEGPQTMEEAHAMALEEARQLDPKGCHTTAFHITTAGRVSPQKYLELARESLKFNRTIANKIESVD